jgi:MraZ protein
VFLGENKHSVDGKGRIVMPRAYREELAGDVVISHGRDRNLVVWKLSDWEKEAERVRETTPDTRKGRAFRLSFFSTSEQQTVAANTGRIQLPAHLREFAALEQGSEAVVVGNFETVEIWNPERFAEQKALGEEVYLADEEDDPDEE